MVAQELVDNFEKFKLTSYTGLEDVADKLSFLVSFVLLLVSGLVVTMKTYIDKSLSCYTPVTPSGSKFDDYLENYCWTEGTYAFLPNETIPSHENNWNQYEDKKLVYYQWIPFILGLQALFFYIPRIAWQTFCYNKMGVDLENLIVKADEIKNDSDIKKKALNIAERIENILYYHRDFRHGKLSDLRRKMNDLFSVLVPSKRLGTRLIFWYFVMKLIYLTNAILQMIFISKFMQYEGNVFNFGWELMNNLRHGRDWKRTRIFPRVTYCYVDKIKLLGASNSYVAQCALPQNMINEKIFAFLFIWIFIVSVITLLTVFLWFYRIIKRSRVQFIKKFLKNDGSYNPNNKESIESFVTGFLQHDGHLIIRMIYLNSGDVVTTNVVKCLYDIYEDYYLTVDLRNDNRYSKTFKLAPEEPATSNNYKEPSAPHTYV